MENMADGTAAECGDDLLRPRAGLGYPGLSWYSRWHLGRCFEDAETTHGTCCLGL